MERLYSPIELPQNIESYLKANVKLKICETKTYTNFLKKVDLSCMGKYCYNISISQKTLQVFIV